MFKGEIIIFAIHSYIRNYNHRLNQVVSIMKQEGSKEYQPPVIRLILVVNENALCGSPVPGGNEDIGYEDWD